MKNLLKTIIYILSFFIIYFLEVFLFENFTIANVKPNLFIITIIIIGLYMKPTKSFIIGVITGLMIDLLNAKAIGITAIELGLLGYGVSCVESMFSIESKLSLIIFIFAGTILYEFSNYIINIIFFKVNIEWRTIIEIISIETLYNVLLTIIFYPLCKKILKIGTEDMQENRMNGYLKKMR